MKMYLNDFKELTMAELLSVNGGYTTTAYYPSSSGGYKETSVPTDQPAPPHSVKPDHYSETSGWEPGWGPDGYHGVEEEESADPMPEAKTQANFPKCDVYAWNLARENGVDPRGEDGVNWSNNLTVDEIYQQHYAGEVDTTPETGNAGKCGYLFFDWASEPGSAKNHMEYCEISADGLSYTQWYTNGTSAPVPHTYTFAEDSNGFATTNPNSTMVFVPLN